MTSITYRGIEVQIIDQNSESGRVLVEALYGQPFTSESGEYTKSAVIDPAELSATSDQPGAFHIAVYA